MELGFDEAAELVGGRSTVASASGKEKMVRKKAPY
jgi:hypothetical protein